MRLSMFFEMPVTLNDNQDEFDKNILANLIGTLIDVSHIDY